MYEDVPAYNHILFQNIPEGTSSAGYVIELISFLERYLPDFPKEKAIDKKQSENDITSKLWSFLTHKCKFNPESKEYPFNFQPEFPQKKPNQKGHGSRIDLATWRNVKDQNMEVVYGLEAKKLPTPGSGREREYVIGKKGGIERFKNEAHGLDDAGSLLENNGIIAYVTEGSFDSWHTQVNTWMSEALWDSSEALQKEYFHFIGKLSSKHIRISGAPLFLSHFWMSI